ncbi:restriction endonuclease subunit S [Lactobacillus helsingborgensis]|uniref:restriction endonuclease subunit S n=1 Tax=Lactobacillus helsingborgensis TaxID=1218494 RepID=UPI001CC7D4F5|nr:restriction endonuclease subunit S [Lactobacillus helsingborgensis]
MNNYKLRELLTIHNGRDYRQLHKGKIPVYGTGGIMTHVDSAIYNGEAILLPRKGTLDNILYVSGEFWTVDTMYWAVTNPKLVNTKYLFYYLSLLDLSSKDTGSALPSMTQDTYYSLDIELPSLAYQEKIANAISNIDSKIANNNAISKELEAMAKTIYDYWFLQFEFPDKDGKPYKSNGGKMIWNDQFKQEIPEGWEVAVINNILGKYPKTKTVESKNYNQGTKYPIIDQSKDSYICGYTNDEEKVLKLSNAIVFGDHSNKSKYVNFPFARGADGTQIISSNNLRLPNYLLYQEIISLPEIEKGYSRHFKFLKMQNIIIPSLNISKKYMDLVDDMLNKQKQIILENKQLKSLRDFLLPLLMNGQVTIEG